MSSNPSKVISTNESKVFNNIIKTINFILCEARNEYVTNTEDFNYYKKITSEVNNDFSLSIFRDKKLNKCQRTSLIVSHTFSGNSHRNPILFGEKLQKGVAIESCYFLESYQQLPVEKNSVILNWLCQKLN